MPTLVVTEIVNAPIDRVFAVISNIPNAAETISGIDKVETLEEAAPGPNNNGAVGKGYKWRETRTMFGKQATEDMWIVEWTPPVGYSVEANSHGCHYLTSITLEAITDSQTTITMSFQASPETFLARVMMKVFAFMTKKLADCLAADLRDVKAAAEQQVD